MRTAKMKRATKETNITIELNLDGNGSHQVRTPIPFLDHMLSLLSKHGLFNLKLKAAGDVDIDDHHTVEDTGIVLGTAFREALGGMHGITRYGQATVPMDEALATAVLDVSGRGHLVYNVILPKRSKLRRFDPDLVEDFLQAFSVNAGITLHVQAHYGRNTHHIIEAVFKALGRALRQAVALDPRVKGVPSTKGRL